MITISKHIHGAGQKAILFMGQVIFLGGQDKYYLLYILFMGQVKTPAVAKLWDAKDGSDQGTLQGHTATVSAIVVMPEQGGDFVTASWDKSIRLWDRSSLKVKKELKGHSQAVWALLPLHGQKLLSGSGDRSIKLWDTHDGKCLGTLNGHGDCVRALASSPKSAYSRSLLPL
jgi:WD40 repeat protein